MSTSHNDALWLRPYGEIDTSVPDCGVRVLPGRLAALTHPLNKGRTVLLPDREWYDPDVCTVVFAPNVLESALGRFGRIPKMMPESEQIRHYDRAGNQPVTWWLAADSLLAAAGFLKVERDRFDLNCLVVGEPIPAEGKILFPELMLRGFAVECLLKGSYLKAGNTLASGGKYLGIKGVRDHDLPQLASAVGFTIDATEEDVLKRLSLIMTGSGRYPITKSWFARRIQPLFGGGMGMPSYWGWPTDDDTLSTVVARLLEQF